METIKHYYTQNCCTMPHDRISIRAADNVCFVMLTMNAEGKVCCIDLTPDAAREFAAQLVIAADLAATE